MADVFTWVIRFLHILSGVMWVGGIFLWGMVIAPSVTKRLAPPHRGPFMGTVLPRLTRYLGIAGVVTVITGFWTMGLIVGFDNISTTFQAGSYGIALGSGVVLSLIMLVVAFWVIMPAANKLLDIMAKAPPAPPAGAAPAGPPPHVLALQKRLFMAGLVNLVLGTLALAVMAWAVNTVR